MLVAVHRGWSLRNFPWAMVLTAFALRVVVMSVLHSYRFPSIHDHYLFGTEMGRIARSLVSGGGFGSPLHGHTGPTAMVGPIYPLIVAAAFKVWGTYTTAAALAVLTFDAFLSAITAAVTYLIGRRAFDERTGIWAGWIWTLYPFAVYWPIAWVWDTSLSTLLFAVVLLATLRLAQSMRTADGVWYGVLWGVTVLTNTTFLPLLPAFLGWLCWRRSRRGQPWALSAIAVTAAFAIALAPWLLRNYTVFGRVLLRSNLGLELALGNSPGGDDPRAWQRIHPAVNPAEMARYRTLGELRYMAEKQRQAVDFITGHPALFVRRTAAHILYFWFGAGTPARVIYYPEVLFGIPAFLALAGLYVAIARRSPAAFPFTALVALFPLVYYVTHPDLRFRHLIEPELMVLAAYGAGAIRRDRRTGARSDRPGPAAGPGEPT